MWGIFRGRINRGGTFRGENIPVTENTTAIRRKAVRAGTYFREPLGPSHSTIVRMRSRALNCTPLCREMPVSLSRRAAIHIFPAEFQYQMFRFEKSGSFFPPAPNLRTDRTRKMRNNINLYLCETNSISICCKNYKALQKYIKLLYQR